MTGTAELVRAFGAGAEIRGDDLVVTGTGGSLHGARVDARGDHRMAMAAAVAAAAVRPGPVRRRSSGGRRPSTSYPGFEKDLERLTSTGRGA